MSDNAGVKEWFTQSLTKCCCDLGGFPVAQKDPVGNADNIGV